MVIEKLNQQLIVVVVSDDKVKGCPIVLSRIHQGNRIVFITRVLLDKIDYTQAIIQFIKCELFLLGFSWFNV